MSRNNNSKHNKNSEHSINPGLTEKLRPLHKTFFSSSVNLHEEKFKITLSGLWLSLKVLFEEIFRRFCNFCLCILSWCKMKLSLASRNKEQIQEKSNTETVLCNSYLTLCVLFSKLLVLFNFDLICSSSNLICDNVGISALTGERVKGISFILQSHTWFWRFLNSCNQQQWL